MAEGLTRSGWRLVISLTTALAILAAVVIAIRSFPGGVTDVEFLSIVILGAAAWLGVWFVLALLLPERPPDESPDHEVVPRWHTQLFGSDRD